MSPRATGFWLVLGAVIAAGILVLTGDLIWLAYPGARLTVVIVSLALALTSVCVIGFFGRAWFRWAFGAAREQGESVARALLNVFRLALVTRFGRSFLAGVAIGIAVGGSPLVLIAIQRNNWWAAGGFGLLVLVGVGLNGLAVAAAASSAQAATAPNLAKWERVFAVEDEVGPVIDFNRQTEIRLRIKPVRGNHWMFGLKFSRSDEFSTDRFSSGYPLWHLGKGPDSNELVFNYYDELSRGRGALLCPRYRDEEIAIVVKRTGPQLVLTVDCNPDWTLSLDARSHRFAQPTAWADARPFQIKAQLEVLSTQSIRQASADPPMLRMDNTLTMDAATRRHAVYYRLRFWNDGGGAITPEVRVTRVVMSDGRDARFSAQLPLLLGWSSLGGTPPALTRQHTAGETVGVIGALSYDETSDGRTFPVDPPQLYVAGSHHHAEIGQTDDKVFVKVQAIVAGQPETVERWFWVQIKKAGDREGYYATTGHSEEAPQPPVS